jgi:hypothetical protein
MTPSTISREELREMLVALHDTAAARGETHIVVQCRGFLEELNRRGDKLPVPEEMIAKLRQTYVDFCRQRRQ